MAEIATANLKEGRQRNPPSPVFSNLVELCDQLRGRSGDAQPSPQEFAPVVELILIEEPVLTYGPATTGVAIVEEGASVEACPSSTEVLLSCNRLIGYFM